MHIYKLKKIIVAKAITIILIGGLILPDIALSMSAPFTSTLAVQSMFKLMVSLTKVDDRFVISEDEETLRKIQGGFREDAKILYFNSLKDRAKEMGLSRKGLKLFIQEHLEKIDFSKTLEVPYETTREPGMFGYEDIYECAIHVAKQGGVDLSEEIKKGVIKRPSEYISRALNEQEKRLAEIFEGEIGPNFGKPWRGEGAPALSHLVLLDYLFFLANLTGDHYTKGTDPFKAANAERLNLGVRFLEDIYARDNGISYANSREVMAALLADVLNGNKYEGTRDIKEGSFEIASDNRGELIDMFLGIGPEGIFDFFIDNIGPELSANLRLIDYFIENNIVGKVRVHIKYAPYGISDVWGRKDNPMYPYIEIALKKFEKSKSDDVNRLASRIRTNIEAKNIIFKTEEFPTYRADLRKAAKEVNEALVGSSGVVFVGDNIYRRLLENRRWPHTEDVKVLENILDYINVPVGIIRMVKSDIFLGAPKGTPTNTTAGLIQFKKKNEIQNFSTQEEFSWGQTFIDTTLMRADEAKRLFAEGKIESPDILIGLETGLIPEIQRTYFQGIITELRRLRGEKGLDNLILEDGWGEGLARTISEKASERGVPNSNIIFLGRKNILDLDVFDPFREGVDPEKWAFFAGVELPENFPENNYIRLFEMLTKALNLWSGKPQPADTPFMRIVQEGKRIYRFIIPAIEPMDYNLLKEIYEGQLKSMKSA